MSICIECFYLKQVEKATKVICSENIFTEKIRPNHPFVTLIRNCPQFDPDKFDPNIQVTLKSDADDEESL